MANKRQSKKTNVVTLATPLANLKANLKGKVRRHLRSLGFRRSKDDGRLVIDGTGKEAIRSLHLAQRNNKLKQNKEFIEEQWPLLQKHFASGSEIDPGNIKPELELVRSNSWQANLFRLAALTWAVPVSNGFGRRLRYLVWDRHNNKLIGLIAIGDPVFNLTVRDQHIGWDVKARTERLVNILDAYVLGAIPPYNMLLGGKLVASLIRSRDIYNDFTKHYGNLEGIISKKEKRARLLVVTTSSSLGRSSVYNRLKLGEQQYFIDIGFTRGWGHFHIPDTLFIEMRNYLRKLKHKYADKHRFGQGPNWRLRTVRAALTALGFKDDLLKHGIQREVFFCELAKNARGILRTGKGRPNIKSLLTAKEVSELAVKRWMVPRAERRPEYKLWQAASIADLFAEKRAISKVVEMR
ncbi:Druantia anti-phage system protein DruA [Ferrovibrio sp.]|uniref:Druantia anti-phage system protein DruA n=1 Tax=Ferrovibrio sp. TaxID=1917215 RepID=UPI003D0A0BB8